MIKVLQANRLTLRDVKNKFNLQLETNLDFFTEWQQPEISFSEYEQKILDQAQSNFLYLIEYPVQEALVKMVVISPMLLVAGFYEKPFRTFAESATEIEIEAEEEIIRGRIDVLVVNKQLWICVIEAKGSQFSLNVGLPQTLTYMASHQSRAQQQFGLVTNGTEFIFVKLRTATGQYGLSQTYSLHNPGNDLYSVVGILKAVS